MLCRALLKKGMSWLEDKEQEDKEMPLYSFSDLMSYLSLWLEGTFDYGFPILKEREQQSLATYLVTYYRPQLGSKLDLTAKVYTAKDLQSLKGALLAYVRSSSNMMEIDQVKDWISKIICPTMLPSEPNPPKLRKIGSPNKKTIARF